MIMALTHILRSVSKNNSDLCARQLLSVLSVRRSNNVTKTEETDEQGFRILKLYQTKQRTTHSKKKQEAHPILPPRALRMPIDQKWSDVWPGPRTFHPASVPLPIRQGVNKLGVSPNKWGNAELMKIPNFLHLTPGAIKGHCEALKKFCTPWPQELTDENIKEHFPLEVISSDYCHSAPTIRDPLARIVTIKFPLSKLELDKHAKDKFLRLVGERYDEETDIVTIVTDKCPLKKQNYDYALYLMTALYHESWITEPWEKEKTEDDLEYYDWDNSRAKDNLMYFLNTTNQLETTDKTKIEECKNAVIALFDEGENGYNLNRYKEASLNILFQNENPVDNEIIK